MRSFESALVLAVVSLPGMLPPMAWSQQTRPMTSRTPQPVIVYIYMPGNGHSSMYQTPYAMQGSYQMPYGGYGSYQMPDGAGYYSQMAAPGGYRSSSPSASSRANQYYRLPTADDIEVSGPLEIPPPRRAVIRLRLPQTWADVSIDGRKVDCFGQNRTYVTPELTEARTFDVEANWRHNGRTVRVEDKVTVEAGQIRTLDFKSSK